MLTSQMMNIGRTKNENSFISEQDQQNTVSNFI